MCYDALRAPVHAGGAYGLGKVRQKELLAACQELKVRMHANLVHVACRIYHYCSCVYMRVRCLASNLKASR